MIAALALLLLLALIAIGYQRKVIGELEIENELLRLRAARLRLFEDHKARWPKDAA